MVANFEAGAAAINQLCGVAGAELAVVPLELERPTGDFCVGPAMSETECLDALNRGMAAVGPGLDLVAVGEMGIGNTASAAAIGAALFGGPANWWTGPGSGLDKHGVAHKVAVVGRGLTRHAEAFRDPIEVLRRLGGREIAAMAGAIVAARAHRVPVLLDGFVAGAAAALLHALSPAALAHTQAAHLSAEPGHARLLERLPLRPLLQLDMRLGEASGAVLAIMLAAPRSRAIPVWRPSPRQASATVSALHRRTLDHSQPVSPLTRGRPEPCSTAFKLQLAAPGHGDLRTSSTPGTYRHASRSERS